MAPTHREAVLQCARAAGIDESRLGEQVKSWSNHAVMVAAGQRQPAAVLRVCFLGNTDRLLAEAALLQELPAGLGPEPISSGREGELTWLLAHRLTGETLAEAWPSLSSRQREAAAEQTAELLQRLYGHRPSSTLVSALLAVPRYPDLVGGAILAWPTSRLRTMLDDPRCTLRDDQKQAIGDLMGRNQALVPTVDRADLGVIHGDLHAANIWWDGARVSHLIDFEWARLAEAWADLGRTRERSLADEADGGGPHQGFVDRLLHHLPAWQVGPEREIVSTLGYMVRQSLLWQPLTDTSPGDHVVHLVDGLLAKLA